MEQSKVTRRRFLQVSAAGAASAMLAACGGTNTTENATPGAAATTEGSGVNNPTVAPNAEPTGTTEPVVAPTTAVEATAPTTDGTAAAEATTAGGAAPATPGSFQEAPMLKTRVDAGDLPPVAERLPKNPYVVPHAWVQKGNYGGTMNLTNSWGGDGISNSFAELMYGSSLLRYLRDGLEVGPGLAESWESNDDGSEWTLHLREGLKWSDGEPFTTADIMYWWEDLVLNEEHSENPPDEARSGKGTLAKFTAVDETTLTLTFDSPAPLTPDRIAMWVNDGTGPRWIAPRHYMEQFHPKYNTSVADFIDHDLKMARKTNPERPVMTGWKLVRYEEGTRGEWERNPYYWCVTKEGDQLPYIDRCVVTGYADQEVEKVNLQAGKVDFTQHWVLGLNDVAQMKAVEGQTNAEIRFIDLGDGTGDGCFFFNYDFKDEKMRTLIHEPKFRQALSHAMNRDEIQQNIYFNTGEKTTGTYSPKAIEYNFNDEAKARYAEWRDSYSAYDPEKAKQLLDEAGVKAGGDGKRTMPDGSALNILVQYPSDMGKTQLTKNELMARDWNAVGLNVELSPMDPASVGPSWQAGEMMSKGNWGIGDGPNHLVFPQWIVPMETERWAPLHGRMYELRGTEKVGPDGAELAEVDTDPYERTPPRTAAEAGSPIEQLWKIYDQTKVEPDAMKRHAMVWELIKVHVQYGPFVQGHVSNASVPFLVRKGLMNVPRKEDMALGGFAAPWIHPTPAVYDPEAFYWDNPEQHT